MTNQPPKQSAELRIVYQRKDRHALVGRVTVRGFDVYFGFRGQGSEEILGSSYHETGKTHTKIAGGRKRIIGSPVRPVQEFQGAQRVWAGGPSPEELTWKYRVRAELGSRRNFIVDLDALEVVPTVDVWLIERGGVTPLADIMQAYRSSAYQQFIDCKIVDWTQPWVLTVAWSPKPEVLESLRKYIADSGIPPGGSIGAVVTGPGPPSGDVVQVWPEPSSTRVDNEVS